MNFGPLQLAAVMDQQPAEHRGLAEVRAIEAALLSPAGQTKQSSSFDRRDVLLGVAEALRDGASVAHLEAIADRLLCHADVVSLAGKTNDVIRTDSGRVISRASTGAHPRRPMRRTPTHRRRSRSAAVSPARETPSDRIPSTSGFFARTSFRHDTGVCSTSCTSFPVHERTSA